MKMVKSQWIMQKSKRSSVSFNKMENTEELKGFLDIYELPNKN